MVIKDLNYPNLKDSEQQNTGGVKQLEDEYRHLRIQLRKADLRLRNLLEAGFLCELHVLIFRPVLKFGISQLP
jgi:hypothetical protein